MVSRMPGKHPNPVVLIPLAEPLPASIRSVFPYILQDRHTKSTYRFWGMEKGYSNKTSGIDISMSQGEHSVTTKPKENKVDDYESFTL